MNNELEIAVAKRLLFDAALKYADFDARRTEDGSQNQCWQAMDEMRDAARLLKKLGVTREQ